MRESELGALLDLDHSRTARWKHGAMYVDGASHLETLAASLELPTMLLVEVSAGLVEANEAWAGLHGEVSTKPKLEILDEPPTGRRQGDELLVLAVVREPEVLRSMVAGCEALSAVATSSLLVGVATAEAWRPELVILDVDLAGVLKYEACRVLSGTRARSGKPARVIAASGHPRHDEATGIATAGGALLVGLAPLDVDVLMTEMRWLS